MTELQRNFLELVNENAARCQAVGLLATVDFEQWERHLSIKFSIKFDSENVKTRRLGHDQELSAYLMIGKRGKIEGFLRFGSIFSDVKYQKLRGENISPQSFDMIAAKGCKYAADEMIRTAQNMAELEKGAA